jgi:surfactin synthase thioesterase subunit
VLAGTEDSLVPPEEMEGWRHKTRGRFARHFFPGAHFYLNEPRSPLPAKLQDIINEHLLDRVLAGAA